VLIKFAHQIFTIGLGVLGLGFITAFHEFGHFIFCKLFRVHTPSFSIGFGPRLFQKKIGGTVFAISAIPMGGYVEIAGAQEVGQGDQKEAFRGDEYSFNQKPYYQKMIILGGGIFFNLIFAYAVLTLLFAFGTGKTPMLYPYNATAVIEKVIPESPAALAGIQPGDSLKQIVGSDSNQLGIHSHELSTGSMVTESFFRKIADSDTKEITLLVQRPGQEEPISSTIQLNCAGKGPRVGLVFEQAEQPKRSLLNAARASIELVNIWIGGTFKSIATMFKQKTTCGLSGPISIISETAKGAGHSAGTFFIILCFISVGLAIINLLPLPIFDGGQALFFTIEAITGRSLDKARLYIHYASWILVIGLMLYLSYKDILRILFS